MNSLLEKIKPFCSDLKLIKKGGQKEVYSSRHSTYGDTVIKVGNYSSSVSIERISREVQLQKAINSKYYPKNFDFIIDINSKEFLIIEEYIDSFSFEDAKHFFNSEKKIVGLLEHLIEGLKVIWDQNIIHRDLKPDNILFIKDYSPVIIDLGIARFLDYETLTNPMAFYGPCTPIYAAPEQLANQKNLIDMRTDFFALGIIILELHLGFHPFHPDKVGTNEHIVENIQEGNYVDPQKIKNTSDAFEALIIKLLKKEPFKRFRHYSQILNFLKSM